METIGLIAGNGRFPVLFARAARARGLRVVAVAHRGETQPELEREVDCVTWVRVGQIGRVIRALKAEGIEIVPSTVFLEQIVVGRGHLAGPRISKQAAADVGLGCRVLAALGPLDVGQCVVVERGVVLAVEAVEGTDRTIERGGRLGTGHAVVVKAAKPGQDMRFDVPAVGPRTIETMVRAGARVLAVQAGAAIMLEGERLIELANRHGVTVVGCDEYGSIGEN